jgi:HAD superfamily hydrolase (TIGR01549 family)
VVFDWVVFDLDGTLLDSDDALAAAYLALGVPASELTYGHVVADECRRLGLALDDYVARYDTGAAQPFPGVEEMLASVARWSVCSNKVRASGEVELRRLGWRPEVALFAEDFGGGPKRVAPVLDRLGVPDAARRRVLFVGDTAHDRTCAADAGVDFALAAWNPRAAPLGDARWETVLRDPRDVLVLLEPGRR